MKKHYGKKIGDKLCQSNFDKRLSDFGSFLDIKLLQKIAQPLKRRAFSVLFHNTGI